jgi:peroxiredoxin/outer membrane lipoprotein-sorting protein
MKRVMIASVAVLSVALGLLVWGQATRPAAGPSTGPTTRRAATPATIMPNAVPLLDALRDAYAKLNSLELTGSVGLNLDAGGRKSDDKSTFAASFQSPNKFRHEMKDDLLVVSNGEKGSIYQADESIYGNFDVPKGRAVPGDILRIVTMNLDSQNPSLVMAISKDAAAALTDGEGIVESDAEMTIDGVKHQVLRMKSPGRVTRVLIDPRTGLVRRVLIDLKELLVARGVEQVNSAVLTIDYSKLSANATIASTAFDWTPPATAVLKRLPTDEELEPGVEPAMALIGKPAPDFALRDMKGAEVKLSSLKGSVVVLDFWAVACPPCQVSLPRLDALDKELAGKGLKVFTVNGSDTKSYVQQFLDSKRLGLSVLLDDELKASDSYKVSSIPQTVVIGKDGAVRQVFIGYGPGSEDELRAAVDAAMKG